MTRLASAGALLLLLGCAGSEPEPVTLTPDSDIRDEGATIEISSDGATARLAPQATDLPADVPLPPGADPAHGLSLSRKGPATVDAILLPSTSDPESVATLYRHELPARGWTISSEATQEEALVMLAEKEGRRLRIGIRGHHGETGCDVTLAHEPARAPTAPAQR